MGDFVKVTSEKIGSNPGGKCVISCGTKSFNGYFKFCYGSRIVGDSFFRANHQPIYETITFQLARSLGLDTTDFFVLCNEDRGLRFDSWREFMLRDPSGRDYYCASKLIASTRNCSDEVANRIVEADAPYLEVACVSDVIGKGQNYRCQIFPDGRERVRYIDFGCNFVLAKDGFIRLPNKSRIFNTKDFKDKLRVLSDRNLISRDNDTFINLRNFIESIPSLALPTLRPAGFRRVDRFLTEEEIRDIQYSIAWNIEQNLDFFDERGILVKG